MSDYVLAVMLHYTVTLNVERPELLIVAILLIYYIINRTAYLHYAL